jgi:hypothetical protein
MFAYEGRTQEAINAGKLLQKEEIDYLLHWIRSVGGNQKTVITKDNFCTVLSDGCWFLRLLDGCSHSDSTPDVTKGLSRDSSEVEEEGKYHNLQEVRDFLASKGCDVEDISPDELINGRSVSIGVICRMLFIL